MLPIVDAQVHIWAADTPQRPWPRGQGGLKPLPPHRAVPISSDSLLREMDALGIDRAFVIPPSWEGERNDIVLAAAREHPHRFAAVGRLDLDAPQAREQLERWLDQPGMFGVQLTFQTPLNEKPLVEGRIEWLWPTAEKFGVPIHVYLPHRHLPLIERAAARHPGLKVAINHLALTGAKKDDEAFADLDKLLAMARHRNVAVKASCLPLYTTDTYPYRRLHPYLRRVYDAFGPKRMFWGTDLSRLPCTYREGLSMFTEEVPWLTTVDKEWIMGRAICEWHGWHLPRKGDNGDA
ncbi:MAG: amidohydrolase [Burkholderiales bacterium]|nr:amidohydrolase [Burkholderiales bacterium]